MKKLLSVLLSMALCASITVVNPSINWAIETETPPQCEHYEGQENEMNPCSDSGEPSAGGDTH